MPTLSSASDVLVPRRPVGIVQALAADHAKARGLVAEIQRDPSSTAQLYPQLAAALRAHDTAESDTLYRALAKGPLRDQIETSRAQHAQLAAMLRRLDATPIQDTVWRSRFAQMARTLEAHLFVEESKVFAAARALPLVQQQHLAAMYRRAMTRRTKMRTLNPPPQLAGQIYDEQPPGQICQRYPPPNGTKWYCQKVGTGPVVRLKKAALGLGAAQPSAQQIAAVAQQSWWDKWFGGGRNLVMNPAARAWIAPIVGRKTGADDIVVFVDCAIYTGDGGVEVECCQRPGGDWVCGSPGVPRSNYQRFASFEQARRQFGLHLRLGNGARGESSAFPGSPIRGAGRLAGGVRRSVEQCFTGPTGTFCLDATTRRANGVRPLPLPPGAQRSSRARQLGMRTPSQGPAVGEINVPASNPSPVSWPAVQASTGNGLQGKYPQYIHFAPYPNDPSKGKLHFINGAIALLSPNRLGNVGHCPQGFVQVVAISANRFFGAIDGDVLRICRPLGIGSAPQGSAAGEIHTDVYGQQYTASNKSRQL